VGAIRAYIVLGVLNVARFTIYKGECTDKVVSDHAALYLSLVFCIHSLYLSQPGILHACLPPIQALITSDCQCLPKLAKLLPVAYI